MDLSAHDVEPVLAAARTGAAWALERLWQWYSPSVLGYLRVQGAADPEGLTSDTFLGLLRTVGTFQGDEERFRSWLFTIAHRRLIDERRAAARRPTESLDDHDQHGDPGPTDAVLPAAGPAEHDALRRLADDRVRRLCCSLAPDQRDVLLLRIVADMTIDEVASALGKTSGACKALQRRGLVALRKIFEHEGVPL